MAARPLTRNLCVLQMGFCSGLVAYLLKFGEYLRQFDSIHEIWYDSVRLLPRRFLMKGWDLLGDHWCGILRALYDALDSNLLGVRTGDYSTKYSIPWPPNVSAPKLGKLPMSS
jgi:hypothetical protein